MKSVSILLTILLILQLVTGNLQAADPEFKMMPARHLMPRKGTGNFLQKLKRGEQVKIAYLGGSITAANGWRVFTREWFAKQYPQAKVEEIHASIGGTGSDLGVYRVQHDALQYKPDLLFVEFAVNDGGAAPLRIWQAMEGIVRQTWKSNPETDICFVYTFRVGYENDLSQGNCPQAASAMEQLAEAHGIPSINVALKVVEESNAGKLIYKADKAPEGNILHFSTDGVHPLDAGHRLYTDVITDAYTILANNSEPVNHAAELDQPFISSHWEGAKMVPIQASMLEGDWQQLPPDNSLSKSFSDRMGTIWEAGKPGSKITFKCQASNVSIYDLLGPDGGQVIITIDGQVRPKPVPRFDSYCTYHRLATLKIAEKLDPQVEHTISVEIHPDQPDRQPVAFRLKNPEEELRAPKYQGTKIRLSQIMILGDVK